MRFWEKIKSVWWCIRRYFVAEPRSSASPDTSKTGAVPDKNGAEGALAPDKDKQDKQEQSGVCAESKADGPGGDVEEAKPQSPLPIDSGGKRKDGAKKNKRSQGGTKKPISGSPSLPAKPELVCHKVGWKWGVFLNAPEECGIGKAMQGEQDLPKEGDDFCLSSFAGNIVAQPVSGGDDIAIRCFYDDAPLIFKLRGIESGFGRQVDKITRGDFVVMVPKDWRRTGDAGIEQEPCTDLHFNAHFFFADKDGINGGFDNYQLPCGKSQYHLQGTNLYDSYAHKTPLFGGPEPPVLNTESSVRMIRVGNEGGGGWRGDNYECDTLLREILDGKDRRQGWFYLRFYGNGRKVVDSGDFRYCEDLRQILVNGENFGPQTVIMPGINGHAETEIRLIGAEGKNCRAESVSDSSYLREDDAVIVSPSPQSDIKMTLAGEGQRGVDIRILPPLIWWGIAKDDNLPEKWHDTPIRMTREDFSNYAFAGAMIDILVPPNIKYVAAGFNGKCSQALRKNNNKTWAVWQLSFDIFADYEEMEQLTSALALHIQCGENTTAVVCIPGEQAIRKTDGQSVENDVSSRGLGRCGRRRGNKGFSCGELRAAGLTRAQIREMGVRMDRRRRTVHQSNVKMLVAKRGSNAKSE